MVYCFRYLSMHPGSDSTPSSESQATVCEDDGSLRVVFPPPLRWPAYLGLPPWLGVLVVGLVTMARDLPAGLAKARAEEGGAFIILDVFLLFFLSLWLTVGALGVYRLLFIAAGRETVHIDAERLTFRRETPLLTRAWTYQLSDVRDLRATRSVVPFLFSRSGCNSRYACDLFGLTGGVIAFDYSGRTIRVGGGIDEPEAQQLVDRILRRFPSLGATGQ